MTPAIVGALIFLVTYVLISARRLAWLPLDRPAAAWVGAVACVAFGVLSPDAALQAVDGHTLLLLFGVMGMGAFLQLDGLFSALAEIVAHRAKTPRALLAWVVWGAGGLSAILTNDAVCVLAAPLIVQLVRRHRLPAMPFLLALATAANTGSVATLVGNPQNMLCASLGGLSFVDHLLLMLPVAVLGLAVNHAILLAFFRGALSRAELQPSAGATLSREVWIDLAVLAGTAIGYSLGANLAWTAAAGFGLLILIRRRPTTELWARMDASLLVFFVGLFVVVGGFSASGVPAEIFARFPITPQGELGWWRLSGIFLVGSNVVSNVPFILIVQEQLADFARPRLAWELLTMASTFAGNLTLLGSVANIIVMEAGRDLEDVGFWDHLKVGLPIALVTTALGTAWILALASWGAFGL